MQPQVETVKKTKRALSLAQNIVRDIEAGAHSPGDRLPHEDEMLARYEVARATLREALRFLELQGVIHLQLGRGGGPVVARPQTGDFANSLSLILHFMEADLRGLLELREAIAPDVAAYAALRATTGDLSALADCFKELERNEADNNFEEPPFSRPAWLGKRQSALWLANLDDAFADPRILELAGVFGTRASGPTTIFAQRSRIGAHWRPGSCAAGDEPPRLGLGILSCGTQPGTGVPTGQMGANLAVVTN